MLSQSDQQLLARAMAEQWGEEFAAPVQPTADINHAPGVVVEKPDTFRTRAQILIERGVPFTALRPKTKIAFIPEWEKKAFTTLKDAEASLEKIDAEASSEKIDVDYNVGAIAQARPGGVWFLELDSKSAFERIEAETGQKIPTTFTVCSREDRIHFYWKQTVKSIQMGNISQSYVKENDWSARVDNQYVVGPKSWHPITGKLYEPVNQADIIEAPDWLVAWCESQKTVGEKEFKETVRNSAGLIPRGAIHGYMLTEAGKMRNLGLTGDEIEPILLRLVEENCVGPINEEKVIAMAHSIAKYEAGKPSIVLVDGHVAGTTGVTTSLPAMTTGMTPEMEKIKAGQEARQAEEKSERDDAIKLVQEEIKVRIGPYPTFPIWAIESTSLYTGFVRPFCDVNSRYEEVLWMSAATIMLNYLALKVRIAMSDIIPSIYLVIVGKKGKMIKSASVKDAMRYFESVGVLQQGGSAVRNAEGKVVVFTAGSPEGLGIEAQRINAKNFLLFYDELEQLTLKAAIEGSAIKSNLLTMYESDRFSNLIKSKKDTYMIEAGTYCTSLIALTTDKRFKTLWSRLCGNDSGLNERSTFLYQPKEFKPVTLPVSVNTHAGALITRQRIDAAVSQGVYEFEDLAPLAELMTGDDPWLNREVIRAQKWALLLAIDLGLTAINEDAVERAIAIVRYEREVKKHLRPYEAENKFAALQLKIVDILMENGGSIYLKKLEDICHAHREGSTMWGEAMKGLVTSQQVDIIGGGKRGNPRVVTLLRIMGSRDEDE